MWYSNIFLAQSQQISLMYFFVLLSVGKWERRDVGGAQCFHQEEINGREDMATKGDGG